MDNLNDLKNQIIENQKMIDELNRKTREVKIIQEISAEINSILDLGAILNSILQSLDRVFSFKHSMILLSDKSGEKLTVTAIYGFGSKGVGAEVKTGEGIIGVVAKRKKIMRMGNIGMQRAYTTTVRSQFESAGRSDELHQKIELPGLPDVQSQVAIPLMVKDQLIGVLAVESQQPNVFDERDELIITIVANQAASAIENARLFEAEKERLAQLNEANHALQTLNESLEEKVRQRTEEVVKQKEMVELKNLEISHSITYAKRIQNTILPMQQYMDDHLQDYFVLYKPKDVVSGDFYWVNKKEDNLLFAAIDCTGHGVPGALVSMVAHANLQRAVALFGLRTPSEILDVINEALQEGFNRSGHDLRDGMDVALCALDRKNMKLEFSGANNSLYLVNSTRKEFPQGMIPFSDGLPGAEMKGDKQPIGYFEKSRKFTNHILDVQKGDVLYLFSDGYAHQFGGPRGKKFMSSRFRELLSSIHTFPMAKQKNMLEQSLAHWMGNTEQVDDICVIGVRV